MEEQYLQIALDMVRDGVKEQGGHSSSCITHLMMAAWQ